MTIGYATYALISATILLLYFNENKCLYKSHPKSYVEN